MRKICLAVAGVALFAAAPALADNTDSKTVTVSGTIVAPLEATVDKNLTMPHLVRPSSGEPNTTVSVACGATNATNTIAYGGNGNPFAAGTASATTAQAGANLTLVGVTSVAATGECATVTVAGETGYAFKVTTGTVVNPSAAVTITSAACYSGGTAIGTNSVVLTGGTAALKCGAAVSATDAAASYSGGSFDVTVTYD